MELDTGWWTIESNFNVWQLGSKCWSAQFELIVDAARSVWEDESATLFSTLLVHEEIYRLQPQDTRVYIYCTYTYNYIHIHMVCIYIDLTQIQQLHSQASEELFQLITKPFDHLISETTLGPMGCITLTLPCHWTFWMANSLGLPKHSSIQFTWELAWMWENCSGSKDGGEAWVWRSTVDFFPLQEGMIYICQLFLWRYFILKLVMMKVCMAQGPQYREAYLTLQASLIRSTWDPSQTLQGLGHYGLEDLQHQWQVRYATRCGRDPWEGQLGCNKILQCDLGIQGVDKRCFVQVWYRVLLGLFRLSFVWCI